MRVIESVDGKYVIGALREAIAIHGDSGRSARCIAVGDGVAKSRSGNGHTSAPLVFQPRNPRALAGRVASPSLPSQAELAVHCQFCRGSHDRQEGLMLATATEGRYVKFNQYQLLGFIKWRSTDVGALRSTYSTLKQRLLD